MTSPWLLALLVYVIAIIISFFVAGIIKLMMYVMHFNKKRSIKNAEVGK
jgi:Flp pilus assembly protein TadB